jgi:hypothetical protein
MSRSAYEKLPARFRSPSPNRDGTALVDRLRCGDPYFAHEVELVDGPLFSLGRVVATPGLLAELDDAGFGDLLLVGLLERHRGGDWGELDAEDLFANDAAVRNGERILSSYLVGIVRCWVITEADRSSTCLLTPREY